MLKFTFNALIQQQYLKCNILKSIFLLCSHGIYVFAWKSVSCTHMELTFLGNCQFLVFLCGY